MSNPLNIISCFFVNLFKAIFASGEAQKLEESIKDFVATDVGKLAVDAVEWAETLPTGTSGVDKRNAARNKLVEDAKDAGRDLKDLGESTLNWFIETALQAVLAKVVAGAASV